MNSISRRTSFRWLAIAGATLATGAAIGTARADYAPPQPPVKTPRVDQPGSIKRALTTGDRAINKKCIEKTLNEAPTGAVWSWKNPKTGNSGTVTPTADAERKNNQTCRSFSETITLKDGRSETITGHACKNPNGSWSMA